MCACVYVSVRLMLRHIHICGGASAVSHGCTRAFATRASSAPRRRRFARKLILRETQRGVPAAAEPAVQLPERSRARRIAHISIRILFASSRITHSRRLESSDVLCKGNVVFINSLLSRYNHVRHAGCYRRATRIETPRKRERNRERSRAERCLSDDMRRDAFDATTIDDERGSQTDLVRHVDEDDRQEHPWNWNSCCGFTSWVSFDLLAMSTRAPCVVTSSCIPYAYTHTRVVSPRVTHGISFVASGNVAILSLLSMAGKQRFQEVFAGRFRVIKIACLLALVSCFTAFIASIDGISGIDLSLQTFLPNRCIRGLSMNRLHIQNTFQHTKSFHSYRDASWTIFEIIDVSSFKSL